MAAGRPDAVAWRFSHDLERLTKAIEGSIVPAIGLAFLSAATLAFLSLPLGAFLRGAGGLLLLGLFGWFHGIFVVILVWKSIKSNAALLSFVVHPGVAAGAMLAVPFLLFGLLDLMAASDICDGGSMPNLPWLWIGWAALALTAAPARAIGLAIGKQPRLIPFRRRVALTALVSPIVMLTGFGFEWRTPDCARRVECCGLFEGGLIILPLLGLFLFLLVYTLAALSAASIGPDLVRPADDPKSPA